MDIETTKGLLHVEFSTPSVKDADGNELQRIILNGEDITLHHQKEVVKGGLPEDVVMELRYTSPSGNVSVTTIKEKMKPAHQVAAVKSFMQSTGVKVTQKRDRKGKFSCQRS